MYAYLGELRLLPVKVLQRLALQHHLGLGRQTRQLAHVLGVVRPQHRDATLCA